ncbi:unnamed protein product [Phytophthora fragariaefolia]|uniref:Unnamed protein product n=1 Tax=Phytophthora fragariaefolia TaxID=1490495 RepID=A0A9W6YP34_9STRA|nr:unnamed protein product [Phytophthora fragariaefolia]
MDFRADLQTALEVVPRGTRFQEPPAAGCAQCAAWRWRNSLGFVGANVLGLNVAADGLNEAGLSAAWLSLEGSRYPSPEHAADGFNASRPVVTSVCSFILGSFASVQEARDGLQRVQLAGVDAAVAQRLLPTADGGAAALHVSVHDRHGRHLVIEFLDGVTVFHDNPNGVLTNDPPLEQQLQLLSTHLREARGGVDTGDLLPGGYGSTERFVRLSVLKHRMSDGYSAPTPHASYVEATDEQRAVSDALHLLNTVVRPPTGEATQWSIVRDHERRMLYIRSTANQLLRRVSLDMIDWADPHARRMIPVAYGNWFVDSTLPLLDDRNVLRTKDFPLRVDVEPAISRAQDPSTAFREIDTKNHFQERSTLRETSGELQFLAATAQMQQAEEAESLSTAWVFIVGSVAGGMLTALLSMGWKMIITDCLRRQKGYQPIAEI